MKLLAPPFLKTSDEGGKITIIRGARRVEFPNDNIAGRCLEILETFSRGDIEVEPFIQGFPEDIRPAVENLIKYMEQNRFLVPTDEFEGSPEEVFWNDNFLHHQEVKDLLSQTSIALVGKNHLSLEMHASLINVGIENLLLVDDPGLRGPGHEMIETGPWITSEAFLAHCAQGPKLLMVASTDIGAETNLRPWNEFSIASGLDFLPVSTRSSKVSVGPYVRPGVSACMECARARVNSNNDTLDRKSEGARAIVPQAFGWHPILLQSAALIAASEILRQHVGVFPGARNDLIVADPVGSGNSMRHRVLRLPRCPVCSPIAKHAAPLVFYDPTESGEAVMK